MSGYLVVVRDTALKRVGQVQPTTLTLTPRFNDVGEWSLSMPLGRAGADLLRQPGAGVLIYRGDTTLQDPLMSGPVGERVIASGNDGPTLTVSGPDDLVWVSGRVAFPNPSRTGANQNTPTSGAAAYDKRSGPAETVIKGYVGANVGPGLPVASRRRLSIETDQGRGAHVADSVRMQPLLDRVKALAATGRVGFTVVQTGATLQFRVFVPADRSSTARFAPGLGNLTEYSHSEKAPSCSYVVLGGTGELTARTFKESTDTTALTKWPGWLMESYVDRHDSTDADEIAQSMAEALLEGGPQTSLAMTVRDTDRCRFGVDYRMGDKVTVEPEPGLTVTDVVREVSIAWNVADGDQVTSQVGSSETTGTSPVIKKVRKLQAKTQTVEKVV